MSTQDQVASQTPTDFDAAIAELEATAEKATPGVLDILETYGQSVPALNVWQPLNASGVTYSTRAS